LGSGAKKESFLNEIGEEHDSFGIHANYYSTSIAYEK